MAAARSDASIFGRRDEMVSAPRPPLGGARGRARRGARDRGGEPFQSAHGLRPIAPPPSTAGTITHRLQPVSQSSSGAGLVTVLILAGKRRLNQAGRGL